jgi:hypothetical protein
VDQATFSRLAELRDIIVKRVRRRPVPRLSERVEQQLMCFRDPKIVRRFFKPAHDVYTEVGRRLMEMPVRAARLHEQALTLDLLRYDRTYDSLM